MADSASNDGQAMLDLVKEYLNGKHRTIVVAVVSKDGDGTYHALSSAVDMARIFRAIAEDHVCCEDPGCQVSKFFSEVRASAAQLDDLKTHSVN